MTETREDWPFRAVTSAGGILPQGEYLSRVHGHADSMRTCLQIFTNVDGRPGDLVHQHGPCFDAEVVSGIVE